MKVILFIFLPFFFVTIRGQQLDPKICYHIPYGLLYMKDQNCRDNLQFYPNLENSTGRKFTCCSVSMKRKSGNGAEEVKGCVAVMKSYIDDDRYEDIIDYCERGKQYKLRNYFIMLGNTSYHLWWDNLYRVNGTKYDVEKLDCLSYYNWINIFLIVTLLFLIY